MDEHILNAILHIPYAFYSPADLAVRIVEAARRSHGLVIELGLIELSEEGATFLVRIRMALVHASVDRTLEDLAAAVHAATSTHTAYGNPEVRRIENDAVERASSRVIAWTPELGPHAR